MGASARHHCSFGRWFSRSISRGISSNGVSVSLPSRMPMKAAAPVGPCLGLADQVLDALRRHAGGEDAVEGARVAALLQVAEDRLPHVEQLAALLLEEGAHERRRVERVRVLVADEEPEPLAVLEAGR